MSKIGAHITAHFVADPPAAFQILASLQKVP
jgi:hypothetical protein